MRKLLYVIVIVLMSINSSNAQFGNILKKKKDNTEHSSDSTAQKSNENSESTESKKKSGGGFFGKVMSKVAKVAGNTVMSTSNMTAIGDLADADVIVSMGTNIYSKDLGLLFTDFLGGEWIDNGDFTMLQIASKDGFQFFKYDGTIKINGKELKHASMGIHTVTEAPSKGNKKITFEKNGSIEGSFEIPVPEKNIKLLSINGQNKVAKVDFTKDITLEVANYSTNVNSLIRVDIVVTMIGMRTLSLLAYVKPAAKITIPAAAFRNLENEGNFNLKDCYLSISDQLMVKAIKPTGKIPSNQMVITGSNDGMWVEATNSGEVSKGIQGITNVEKRNAAYAMPLSFAKKIAVGSLYAKGEISYQTEKEKTEEKTTYDVRDHAIYKETTKTKTRETRDVQFPPIPNSYLDEILANVYTKMSSVLSEVNSSTILPPNAIPSAASFGRSQPFMYENENNNSEYLRAYQNLGPVRKLSTVFNMHYGVESLLKDVQADAFLKVSLISKLYPQGSKSVMNTYMEIELLGAPNGSFRSFAGNTKYFTMRLDGINYELKKDQQVDFAKVFQVDYFVSQFKEKLKELQAKERAIGDYETYWNLQK
ncbi:MAG: hypothetical protein JNL75_03445 [Chitinophagales bacterium]|nr:hypothetical protein [Chitinophagales bacterium]